ncbi:hypothetical protein K490DRAFT_61887 [Saccharata proteae CBS 121410]|uniref:Uncharacterized protein n=1 Tax=Saccharata proteae CBS 121410 TaxID=1314787 RepID=A0A9P4M0V1_9PEZI|nr:hypothetical protein K490DRAFT_61887 [Saccharata proteae CBS 121410]
MNIPGTLGQEVATFSDPDLEGHSPEAASSHLLNLPKEIRIMILAELILTNHEERAHVDADGAYAPSFVSALYVGPDAPQSEHRGVPPILQTCHLIKNEYLVAAADLCAVEFYSRRLYIGVRHDSLCCRLGRAPITVLQSAMERTRHVEVAFNSGTMGLTTTESLEEQIKAVHHFAPIAKTLKFIISIDEDDEPELRQSFIDVFTNFVPQHLGGLLSFSTEVRVRFFTSGKYHMVSHSRKQILGGKEPFKKGVYTSRDLAYVDYYNSPKNSFMRMNYETGHLERGWFWRHSHIIPDTLDTPPPTAKTWQRTIEAVESHYDEWVASGKPDDEQLRKLKYGDGQVNERTII